MGPLGSLPATGVVICLLNWGPLPHYRHRFLKPEDSATSSAALLVQTAALELPTVHIGSNHMVQIVGIVPSVPSGESRKDGKLPSLVVMWANASTEALLKDCMEASTPEVAPAAMALQPEG